MRSRPHIAFLTPALILLAGVTAFPLLYTLWLSQSRYILTAGAPVYIGAGNYGALLGDGRFWNALYNTVYFTAVSVTLELALGLSIALLLDGVFRGKSFVRALVIVPWAIPTVVSARMWEWMYNADYGLFNYLLGAQVNWLGSAFWAMNAAIAMDVWKTTPFVVLLMMAGLAAIPRELYAAAKVDGATGWAMFSRITLPLLIPVILVTLIFRTIDAFRVFDAIYVLTGGGPANSTETLSIYAYKTLFQTLRFGYGSAISMAVFIIVGAITAAYVYAMHRRA